MSFGQPLWFWAFLLLLPLAALFLRNERQRSVLLRRLIAARLEAQLAGNVSLGRRRLRFAVLLLALACIILSLAQPRWGYIWEEHKTHGRDVLIAIDCSKSMLANDVEPSRLARAKLAAEDLIAQLGGDRVGLIAFAGTAFLQAPLTADHDDVLTALHELDTDIIPRGGTDIAEAIRTAVDAFGKGESDDRALILFTDGEELEESGVDAARALKGEVRIFTVGMGTTEGAVLSYAGPNGEREYVKDPDGQVVKSRLDETRLREIAQETNGFYVHLLSGPAEMQQIFRDGLKPMSEHDLNSQYSRRPIERYQWPLAAGMVLLAGSLLIGERKRKLAPRAGAALAATAVAALFLAAWPGSAHGANEGIEAYDRQDYKGALDSFDLQLKKRPENGALNFDAGSAAYKTGDLDRAMEGFSSAVTSSEPALREKAEYNLGNTLFQRGVKQKEKPAELTELRNALQHYDAALKVQPKDGDAQFNRDVVKNLIAELEKEPPKQDQQQQKDQQKKDQQKDQKDQKDQNQQGQKQDQQNKDQQSKDQKSQPQQGQGQKQDQQNSGAGGQPQDQQDQKGGQKDSQQQGKQGDQKKDSQQGEPKDQQQAKSGEQKEKGENGQPQEPKDGKDGKGDEQQQPQPATAGQDQQQPQHKPSGELKDAGQPPKEGNQQSAEQQAAEEARAAAEDRMTEEQARNLLESLKTDDRRVQLLNPKGRKDISGNYRDW